MDKFARVNPLLSFLFVFFSPHKFPFLFSGWRETLFSILYEWWKRRGTSYHRLWHKFLVFNILTGLQIMEPLYIYMVIIIIINRRNTIIHPLMLESRGVFIGLNGYFMVHLILMACARVPFPWGNLNKLLMEIWAKLVWVPLVKI